MKSVVIPLPVMNWGGLHGVLAAIDAPLKRQGYRQTVLIPPHADEVASRLDACGVAVEVVALPRLRRSVRQSMASLAAFPLALGGLARLSVVKNADVFQAVGVHHPHSLALSSLLRKPLVWQIHSDSVRGPLRHLARTAISLTSDGVVANGRRIGQAYVGSRFGTGNHAVFYPPIDLMRFSSSSQARCATRERLGISEDQLLIGTVGNRNWQKNHRAFVELAERFLPMRKQIRFIVVGAEVADYAARYDAEVMSVARRLNSCEPGYVTFEYARGGVESHLQAMDLMVMTSHSEGIPLAVAEAMAVGKPVVSVDVGAIAEIVRDGTDGFIVSAGGDGEIFRRVGELISCASTRRLMGASASERAAALFSPESVAQSHAEIYGRALCSRH
jgi:glycosyltransferase involved in cell wall biosynthesis